MICNLDCALAWTEATEERVLSYVNSIPTSSGGAHENGLRGGLTKALRNYLTVHNLVPRGLAITADDVREGLVAVLAIKLAQPQFQGQTKERLNNTEITPAIDGIVRTALENALNANRTAGDAIANRVVLAARAMALLGAQMVAGDLDGTIQHRDARNMQRLAFDFDPRLDLGPRLAFSLFLRDPDDLVAVL